MEWDAPAIVLSARAFGEADALASVLTETHGVHRGLAKGGLSRSRAGTWQAGNLVQAHWAARLPDQLGHISAEMVHPAAALAMADPLALAVLSSACAVAEGALPERQPHPRAFGGLLSVIAALGGDHAVLLPELVRWELTVLSELGYGLDVSRCALSGDTVGLAWVSPRTGRAVTDAAAGEWRARMLRLPGYLAGGNASEPADWQDGLRLTGHFLERDAFGHQHRPLPAARHMLYDRVGALTKPP